MNFLFFRRRIFISKHGIVIGPKQPQNLSLVKLSAYTKKAMDEGYEYPWNKEDVFVYLGEIKNMMEHCIVVRNSDGRVFSCYHIEDFVELSEEEI